MASSFEQLNLRVPQGTNDALTDRARMLGLSKAALVNRLIKDYLAAQHSELPAGDPEIFD